MSTSADLVEVKRLIREAEAAAVVVDPVRYQEYLADLHRRRKQLEAQLAPKGAK